MIQVNTFFHAQDGFSNFSYVKKEPLLLTIREVIDCQILSEVELATPLN